MKAVGRPTHHKTFEDLICYSLSPNCEVCALSPEYGLFSPVRGWIVHNIKPFPAAGCLNVSPGAGGWGGAENGCRRCVQTFKICCHFCPFILMPLYPLINNTSNQEIFRFWFPQRDLHDWRIWERVHYYYQGAGKPRQFADIWEQRMILRYVLQVKDNGTSKWIKSFDLKHHESKMFLYRYLLFPDEISM